MEAAALLEIVKGKIQHLRPKLLDLSRRNPLIATKLSPRSNAHIRVVDELPDILFYKLNNGNEMRLIPLPEIEEDPKDEDSKRFRDALANGRLTDVTYLVELEVIDRDADDYLDQARSAERALKDRIRAELGLPERPQRPEHNLVQHARNNNITPSYDLPEPTGGQVDRHLDDDIQTLLLPKDFERKLNNIASKCRTWIQETGINVLHVSYGFLEWSEPNQTETSFAPLVLAPAEIEKRRSRNGTEFWISGTGDEPEVNAVLAEKLKEFGIVMPAFEPSSVEEYFGQIAELSPKNIKWKVRRQVAIGVFPSARMAMYHDLDPDHPTVAESEIVRSLLGGTTTETATPFADEYNVDEPAFEQAVPCIVLDADSSQFSTLVDIANGKNLAVEGPPGTGKSQTIVNAIGAALADGKTVLFVAEKLAALNVVKARLEAIGLGEFLLPLQAERSTREQVIASVRARVEMESPRAVRNYDNELSDYRRVRAEIAGYIEILTTPFADSGFTTHEILGKSISTYPALAGIASNVLASCAIPSAFLNEQGLRRISEVARGVEVASEQAGLASDSWRGTGLLHPERFTVEEVCDLAHQASEAFLSLSKLRSELQAYGLGAQTERASLEAVLESLTAATRLSEAAGAIAADLLVPEAVNRLSEFVERCDFCVAESNALAAVFAVPLDPDLLERVERDLPLKISATEI